MKKVRETIVSALLWFSGLTIFSLGSLVILLIGLFNRGNLFENTVKVFCRILVLVLGIRISVRYPENYQSNKQYILMMNHVNMFDAFVFYSRFPGKARGIEEESHFNWPVYGWVIRKIGQIPISRTSGKKAMEALKKAALIIREREDFSVAILPEGTRTRTGKLTPFKKGGFLLAMETGLDILPLIQKGSYAIKKKGCWLIRPGKVEFIFEKPVSTRGHTRETLNSLMDETLTAFRKHLE